MTAGMRGSLRATRLMQVMVRLADTLVEDYDIVDLLQELAEQCGELVGSTATGILLADPGDHLEVVASSDESANIVEVLQLAGGAGPCVECYRRGRVVTIADIASDATWPEFRDSATEQGFRSVHAVPLRLRKSTIGSMNLFRAEGGDWSPEDAEAAQALADVATIGILQARAADRAQELNVQLQHALDSRVVLEQAKGFVAYRRGVSLGEAFQLIRGHARQNRQRLGDVAQQIVSRRLEL